MYKLKRICAINWYLATAKDVDIRDATAFIGPTGAGKSSMQDAIQTVICAGNHRHIRPNASANGRSERKIIDYCLGYTAPKSDGGTPARQSCETILALVFAEERRDGSEHEVTVGLAMSARAEDARETILSRFIAPGYGFSVEHAKENDEHGVVIKQWEDIERDLKRACPNVSFYRHGAERFVADMLAVMRKNGRQPDPKHFLHAFTNAVTFKPIFDPTQFVRSYILTPDPLDVERVRQDIQRWRFLAEAVRTIEEKLKRLGAVRRKYGEWGDLVIARAMNRWKVTCARTEKVKAELRKMSVLLSGAESTASDLENIRQRLKVELDNTGEELERLRSMLDSRDIKGKLSQIDTEAKNLRHELTAVRAVDTAVREALQAVASLAAARDFLPASANATAASAKAALDLLERPGLEWMRHHANDVGAVLARLPALGELRERLALPLESRHAEISGLRAQRDATLANVTRAASGGTALSDHTVHFLRLLKDADIEAQILCDVVEVIDPEWQFAAESLLGLFREAVIVAPRHLARANDVLFENRNRYGLHKVRLVKTNRTDTIETRLSTDSVATVLRSDNAHATALICNHIGGVKKADTLADLNRATRAIMRDGRATSGLAYSVNPQNITLILGRQDGSMADSLRADADKLKGEIARISREALLLEQVIKVGDAMVGFSADLEGACFNYEENLRQQAELERRKQAVTSEGDEALLSEIDAIQADNVARKAEIEDIEKDLGGAREALGAAKGAFKAKLKEMRSTVRAKRAALVLFQDADLLAAIKLGGGDNIVRAHPRFAWKHPNDGALFDATIREAEAQLDRIDDRVAKAGNGARGALDTYLREYGIDRPMSDDNAYSVDYKWLVEQYEKLERNELRQHKQQAEEAEEAMYLTLREDLLVNLNGRFQKLDIQLKTLNAQLRRHRFTGQTYKFGKKPDPRFERLRRLAMEVGNNPDKAQSIIERRSGDLFLQAAMDELNEYLTDTGGDGMEDYRNYFTFDLYMYPSSDQEDESTDINEADARSKGFISLSGRATVGSGGEGQAPFYVAIAASMALAYYPGGHPGGEPSGMGLVLFDEAFNKLDITTTQSLIRFFKDLGLQLILAAPEDKRPTFTEVLDCIVSVNKDVVNKTVHLDSEYPTPYAQAQIAAINPDHVGVEGFRKILEDGNAP